MMREVRLSIRADMELMHIRQYLFREWGAKSEEKFLKRLDKALNLISKNPSSFPKTEIRSGLYRILVVRQVTLYYTFTNEIIYVVSAFDNRQNPDKLKNI